MEDRKAQRMVVLLKAIDCAADKTSLLEDDIVKSVRNYIVNRWSEGWDNNIDNEGRRTFERMADWSVIEEVIEELADAFIYSVEVGRDGNQVSKEEEEILDMVAAISMIGIESLIAWVVRGNAAEQVDSVRK